MYKNLNSLKKVTQRTFTQLK